MIKITFYRPRIFTREFWRQWKQRRKQGFIDEDTYSLSGPLAEFISPRLKRFSEISHHSPEWQQMIDKMAWSMNEIVENDGSYKEPDPPNFSDQGMIDAERERKQYYAKLQEGLSLFGRNFRELWW